MSEVNLNNLTLKELKEQARVLGIDLKGASSTDLIRERIYSVIGEPADAPAKKPKAKKGWLTIVIAESEKDKQPVFVGVDGHSYRIRRGENVAVPPQVVEALKQAIQRIPQKDGTIREVPSYPFQIVA